MSKQTAQVPQKAHATLGASAAHRWMACPGSNNLAATIPGEDVGSEHAKMGTAAHALAELSLTKKQDPSLWLGMEMTVDNKTKETRTVTEEMVDFVRTYVEHCLALAQGCDKVWIEHRFNLSALNPPGPMYGTSDFVAYNAALKRLYVCDLKYGQGVVVEAKDNEQLKYYALGAALSPEVRGLAIHDVQMYIVQPRAQHPEGVIRDDVISLDDLIGFADELLVAAKKTLDPAAPLVPGEHCRFCRASGACPAQLKAAEAVAMVAFEEVPIPAMPPAPETLTLPQIVQVLKASYVIEDWLTAVRGRASTMLTQGHEVPGFKMVQKRPTRKWVNEKDALAALEALGAKKEDLLVTELRSPAQVEKLVGKKLLPTEYVIAVSSGLTMVEESDKRPAVTPGNVFDALPDGSVA